MLKKCSKGAERFATKNCKFEVFDKRLEEYSYSDFDFILNTENIEHIIDD